MKTRVREQTPGVLRGKTSSIAGIHDLLDAVEDLDYMIDQVMKTMNKVSVLAHAHNTGTAPVGPYHTGVYDGIECVLALLQKRKPEYLNVDFSGDIK